MNTDELKHLRGKLDRRIGERDRVQQDLENAKREGVTAHRDVQRVQRAMEIVREVALQTQQQLQYHIGSVVSNAEAAVFDDPYEMEVCFEQRRGRTECDLWFKRGDEYYAPLYAGLGAVDIAAFALRVASWNIARRPTRAVLLCDEPYRHLKGAAANRRAIQMTKAVAHETGLQVIMVSDERAPREDVVAGADKVLEVRKEGGISEVLEVSD